MFGDPNLQKDVTRFTRDAKRIGEAFKMVSGYTES